MAGFNDWFQRRRGVRMAVRAADWIRDRLGGDEAARNYGYEGQSPEFKEHMRSVMADAVIARAERLGYTLTDMQGNVLGRDDLNDENGRVRFYEQYMLVKEDGTCVTDDDLGDLNDFLIMEEDDIRAGIEPQFEIDRMNAVELRNLFAPLQNGETSALGEAYMNTSVEIAGPGRFALVEKSKGQTLFEGGYGEVRQWIQDERQLERDLASNFRKEAASRSSAAKPFGAGTRSGEDSFSRKGGREEGPSNGYTR